MSKPFRLISLAYDNDQRVQIKYEVATDIVSIETEFKLLGGTWHRDDARETATLVLAQHLGSHPWVTPADIDAEIERVLPYRPAGAAVERLPE